MLPKQKVFVYLNCVPIKMSKTNRPALDWTPNTELGMRFEDWKSQVEDEVLLASGDGKKAAYLCSFVIVCSGKEGKRILETEGLSEEKEDYKKIFTALEKHVKPQDEEISAAGQYPFLRQGEKTLSEFYTEVETVVNKMNMADASQKLIRNALLVGLNNKEIFEECMEKTGATLTAKEVLEIATKIEKRRLMLQRLGEVSNQKLAQSAMQLGAGETAVNAVHAKGGQKPAGKKQDCNYCTRKHPPGKQNCPARDSECHVCQKKGHWAAKCRSRKELEKAKKAGQQEEKAAKPWQKGKPSWKKGKTHMVDVDDDSDSDEIVLESIQVEQRELQISSVEDSQKEIFTQVKLPGDTGQMKLSVKVDIGAGGNVMPLRVFRKMHPSMLDENRTPVGLASPHTRLTAYNGGPIPCYGALTAEMGWKPTDGGPAKTIESRWYVADTPGPAILGLPSCRKLGVVTLNCALEVEQPPLSTPKVAVIKSTEDLIQQYPDQFKGIGRFPGEYKIHLKEGAQPVVHGQRKCPIAMKPKVKEELDKMVQMQVITPTDEPTDWVSSLAYAWKESGDIRICLDPRDLNKCIRRDHHRVPTVEEVAHEFAGSKFFTKLDARHGYWSVVLDQESSLLTTFLSPFGRYRFLRLPFGLVCSQDVFQKRMDQILEKCRGCIGIADDITVHGKTEEEHDENLHQLMAVAKKWGLVFNPKKTHVKSKMVKFFGCLYDEHGVHPDPAKVADVQGMESPTNITKLQEFLGMATFLSPFIAGLSALTAPLRQLLKKENEFTWDATFEAAFQKVKDAVAKNTTLKYFDTNKPVTIQVDASQDGLGAALVQEDGPVAFASKALTDTECRYANIEREMLAVVFGIKRFHTYVYGRNFTVESDHKPLEAIATKNLADTPARLQRMLLNIQGYDYLLKYRPGKEMLLADALSRYQPQPGKQIALDVAIHFTNITEDLKSSFQVEFSTDPTMKALMETIIDGWPENIKEVPKALRPYWMMRASLSVEDGLILKGEALVIPPKHRERVLKNLHKSHQGITKTQLLAKNMVYWPGYTKDIEAEGKSCEACMRFQAKNAATPMEPTPPPSRPWQVVASDLFSFDGHEYLVVGDYYSKMFFHRKYPTSQVGSEKTIMFLKEIFSEHGIPETLRTDNGGQYASYQFKEFCKAWNISHITSSPHYPQSNGFAEGGLVKTVKKALQRARYSGSDQYLALLDMRATPVDAHLPSPAEMLYQRKVRTTIPGKIRDTNPSSQEIRSRLEEKALQQKEYKDRSAKPLAPLYAGQPVAWYCTIKRIWIPAKVLKKLPNDSYLIQSQDGTQYRRTRQHLKERGVRAPRDVEDETQLRPRPPWNLPVRSPLVRAVAPGDVATDTAAESPTAAVEQPTAAPAAVPPRRSSRVSQPPSRLTLNPRDKFHMSVCE